MAERRRRLARELPMRWVWGAAAAVFCVIFVGVSLYQQVHVIIEQPSCAIGWCMRLAPNGGFALAAAVLGAIETWLVGRLVARGTISARTRGVGLTALATLVVVASGWALLSVDPLTRRIECDPGSWPPGTVCPSP